jgi:hypothetical protein
VRNHHLGRLFHPERGRGHAGKSEKNGTFLALAEVQWRNDAQ